MRDDTEERPDPDALLASIQKSEDESGRGKLKIFFGACAGVGKTYTMLTEAKAQLKAGVDVVVGLAETHGREETSELLDGFEILPKRTVQGRSNLHEFDIEAALKRHPQLLVVDELAHSNLPGSRHAKRWQDVEELLEAGIDVYTALNVQHLESLNDVVAGITGITVRETVPDRIFDEAWEVRLVDIPADELLKRLDEGKIYLPNIAARAAHNFFRKGNIIALRELALRRTADRVDAQMRAYRQESAIATVWEAQDRLLVAIGTSTDSARLVRETARLANRMKAEWIAVHVEDPSRPDSEEKKRVFDVLNLAGQLGAETTVLSGSDPVAVIAEYARRRNVTKIVLGAKPRSKFAIFRAGVADKLLTRYPDLDVVQIALEDSKTRERSKWLNGEGNAPAINYLWATIACVATLVATAFLLSIFEPANVIILILLMAVAVGAVWGCGPAAWAVFLAALAFDFFYVPPILKFTTNNTQYIFTFFLVLITAVYVGLMSGKLRREADLACVRDFRSSAVAELAKELTKSITVEQVAEVVQRHLSPLLQADISLGFPDHDDRLSFKSKKLPDIEVAQWSYDHSQEAGLGTMTLSAAKERMIPLLTRRRCWGVMALSPTGALTLENPDTKRLLDACAVQVAQTIERIEYSNIAKDAMIRGEAERMRATLLGAVSRDISLPVNSILKTTEKLLPELLGSPYSAAVSSIQGQAALLRRLTGNLKEMARLQAGNAELDLAQTDISQLITEAAGQFWSIDSGKTIQTDVSSDLPKVRIDRSLIMRALENLIDNAEKYSPKGTPVEISLVPKRILDEKTQSAVGRAELRFGPGIEFVTVRLTPLQSLETAFDKVVGLTRFQAAAVGGMAKGEVSTENLSGPVGIAGMAGSALTAGVSAFLEFVALISIAIGFMNLIPIPALDGGQLVILGIEGLMGRSLARGLKEKLGAVSMALLLLLAVYVTMNDIGRLGG